MRTAPTAFSIFSLCFFFFCCCNRLPLARATKLTTIKEDKGQTPFIVQENDDGIVINVQNNHTVELAVEGNSAFRVSVSYDGSIQAGKIQTVMLIAAALIEGIGFAALFAL